jgi:hypothetical protein
MNFYIKILSESRSRQRLKVDGKSGLRYIFEWDAKVRAYCYHPRAQNEVDDLFSSMGRTTSTLFAPVNIPVAKAPAAAPSQGDQEPAGDLYTLDQASALLAQQLPQREPLKDTLVEQCLHRGVIVTDEDTNENAVRLIAAYDKGAKEALSSLPAVKKRTGKAAAPRAPRARNSSPKPETAPSNENPN